MWIEIVQLGLYLCESLWIFLKKHTPRRSGLWATRLERKWATHYPKEWQAINQLAAHLQGAGWSKGTVDRVYYRSLYSCTTLLELKGCLEKIRQESSLFASPFQSLLLQEEVCQKGKSLPVLAFLLIELGFPKELTLREDDFTQLMEKMNEEVSPASPFWRYFSRLVAQSFADQSLADPTDIARQVHQLRYLLSYQQASWVRKKYGSDRSDWQALQAYLTELPVWAVQLNQSARLHNKLFLPTLNQQEQLPTNIKVLLYFHTEFILSEKGDFALICQPTNHDWNGMINGASFNYARSYLLGHVWLDMDPIGPHDPLVRKGAFKQFQSKARSPNRLPIRLSNKKKKEWRYSYFNPEGIYGRQGKSRADSVRLLNKQFLNGMPKNPRK